MKRKQFLKGVNQIAQEGAIQIFRTPLLRYGGVIVGVVGHPPVRRVLEYRDGSEYNVGSSTWRGSPYEYLRWIRDRDGGVREDDRHPWAPT